MKNVKGKKFKFLNFRLKYLDIKRFYCLKIYFYNFTICDLKFVNKKIMSNSNTTVYACQVYFHFAKIKKKNECILLVPFSK